MAHAGPPNSPGLVLASPLISTRSWIADANALRAQLPADVQATLATCDPPRPITPVCEKATEFSTARSMAAIREATACAIMRWR